MLLCWDKDENKQKEAVVGLLNIWKIFSYTVDSYYQIC